MFYGLAGDQQQKFAYKINLFIALAPTTKVDNMRSKFISFIGNFQVIIEWSANLFGLYEAFGESSHVMSKLQCKFVPELCNLSSTFTHSDDIQYDNADRLSVYEAHMPAGSSMRSLDHFGQMYKSKKFEKFDFGQARNQKEYGQDTPPEIDLSRIRNVQVPIAFFVGKHDEIATVEDAY